MLTHGDRHLPCVQRPHTRCHSPTRSVTLTPCLIRTHHTRGGTHPWCLIHTGGFAHTCRLPRARGFFPLRCPFNARSAGKHTLLTPAGALTRGVSHPRGGSYTSAVSRAHVVSSPCGAPFTRRAGKHARWHARHYTTRTRGLIRARGLTCSLIRTRGLIHTRAFTRGRTRGYTHTRGLFHTRGRTRGFFHIRGLWHTRGRTPT